MTILHHQVLALLAPLAVLAAGCSASSSGTAGYGGRSGGSGGVFGAGGSGGGASGAPDAGIAGRSDAGRTDALALSLSADAPTYKWDACVGCAADSASSKGGSGGGGGVPGSGGTSSGTGNGGSTGSAGAAAGGATGRGGSAGSGGIMGVDAGPLMDAPIQADATADLRVLSDAGVGRETGPADAGSLPDATVADLRSSDSYPSDTTSACVAAIEAVVPATDSFKDFHLVAGPNVKVVLRARVISGGPAAGANWTWQANRDGNPLPYATGTQDPAAVAFSISAAGNYSFTATSGKCQATVQTTADVVTNCPDCGRYLNLRFAPPPSTNIPVQAGSFKLIGSEPFTQNVLVISSGVAVKVAPSLGSGRVASYVRINSAGGDLVADGLADPQTGGFATQLLDSNYAGTLLKYDVLVVPVDGSNGGTVGATAPQLFLNLSPGNINTASFNLAGGVAVAGSMVNSTGQAVADVRVMLTNQDPAAVQASKLIFSSVGRSDAQGKYLLHAQPGKYWVSLSPPSGSGLPEALVPSSVTLAGDATMDFKWDTVTTATLMLNVVDATGNPSVGTRVRLTSAQAKPVGTLTSTVAGTADPLTANGNVQVESITSAAGVATFANLPEGASYDALLVPAVLGPSSATTAVALTLPKGGATLPVALLAQGLISGQLTAASAAAAIDWTHVQVIAYDRNNDTPEVPLATAANPSGTFSIGVSPGRSYAVLVVPDASTGLARTFVGPGLLQASEFSLTQNVQATMEWSSTVMDNLANGLPGTAMQVFCIADWPYCVDPTLPLAETTSGDNGAFQFALPDPATR